MDTMLRKNTLTVTVSAAALAFGLTACGDMNGGAEQTPEMGEVEETTENTEGMEEEGTDGGNGDTGAMNEYFGPECEVPEGEGGYEDMPEDPVATAIAGNPALATLSDAIEQAGLAETLDSAEDITVFAPNDDAFDALPQEELDALLADQEQLSEVLNYHVVEGRPTPEELEDGTFTSLQGGEVTTSGSGEEFTVDEEAQIVCGNVPTANATVYVIDGVLTPS